MALGTSDGVIVGGAVGLSLGFSDGVLDGVLAGNAGDTTRSGVYVHVLEAGAG